MEKPCYSCPKGLMDGYETIYLDRFCRNQCFKGYGGCPTGFCKEMINIPEVIGSIKELMRQNTKVRIFLDAPNFLDPPFRRELPAEVGNQHLWLLQEIINAGIKPYLRIETTVFSILEGEGWLDFFNFLRQAGVQEVWLGVESGSPELRDKYNKPSFENEQLTAVMQWLRNVGILCCWYLVVGYEDTEESIGATENFILEAQPDRIFLIQLLPYNRHEQFVSLGELITRIPDIEKYQARLQKIAQELDEKLCRS